MRTKNIIKLLNELYMRADFTDGYGDHIDTDPYKEAVDEAIKALKWKKKHKKTTKFVDNTGKNKCIKCGYECDDNYYIKNYCTNCGAKIEEIE